MNDNRRVYGERLARWERAVEWPLTIAACAFLAAYATQILAKPQGIRRKWRDRSRGWPWSLHQRALRTPKR
jgi:hypothetical protein